MNISMNNLNSYISQLSQVNSSYSTSTLTQALQNQSSNADDQMAISPEGRMMSKMMRREESKEAMEAHKAAFEEAYSELNIGELDTENMTDEEIEEVLSAFEAAMSEHMPDDYTPASEMSSDELRETVSHLQGMSEHMSEKGQYGPPPGGPGGPGGAGGAGKSEVSSLLDALESDDEDEEEDLIDTLLDALNSTNEDENNIFSTKSMAEIMSLIGQYNNI